MPASATANPAILPGYLSKKKTQPKPDSTPTKSQVQSTKDTTTVTKSSGKEKMKKLVGALKKK
jgi:hypothetical protein